MTDAPRPGSGLAAPRPHRAWLTWTVFAVTAATTAAGLLSPATRSALDRAPAFFTGEWWRLISPISINPEGWHQIIFNAAALLVLGTLAERVYGRLRWGTLYLAGALAGEIFSYATDNYSAGSSVAIAGLLGGLAAWVGLGHARLPVPPRVTAAALPAGAVVLVVIGDEHGAPILIGCALGALMLWHARRTGRTVPTAEQLGIGR
ncbi:rhomboid family intramembrane serine protease [Streptosporangium sp. NBC_01756]|uniref:rhomboid family intramembrane serine protease n=1 Tax=Streptosporangium sp. NBC_01756 TaxID=2975950 RepID=UPI002DDC2357|nr:rhomboid family intramembrane serine protease [Streptosporangium sp. NBC_01756]WSC84769.1 rhomboid family intramembrane serine protease [Streptosporangium sp. NBC_01756]